MAKRVGPGLHRVHLSPRESLPRVALHAAPEPGRGHSLPLASPLVLCAAKARLALPFKDLTRPVRRLRRCAGVAGTGDEAPRGHERVLDYSIVLKKAQAGFLSLAVRRLH